MEGPALRTIGAMDIWESPDKTFNKHTLQAGTGQQANDGSVCSVYLNFVGQTEVSEDDLGDYKFGEEVEVTIGEGDTVLSEHLDNILLSMKEGERSYIKSKLNAKGEKMEELETIKNTGLKFNVHLRCLSRTADSSELEQDERLERAQHHKDKGTELFKGGRQEFALKRYKKALQYVLDMEPIGELPQSLLDQHNTLKCQCYLNLAVCHARTDSHQEVVDHCTHALEVEPNNVKGLFRRGQAYTKLHQYDKSKQDLNKALALEPENKAVSNLLKTAEAMILKEKQLYKKMFS